MLLTETSLRTTYVRRSNRACVVDGILCTVTRYCKLVTGHIGAKYKISLSPPTSTLDFYALSLDRLHQNGVSVKVKRKIH